MNLNYNEEQTLQISASPAKEAAGKTVTVKNLTQAILSVQETEIKLDENGCAEIHIKGKLAGTGLIQYDLQDTELTAKTEVHIENRALISSIQFFTDSEELRVGKKMNVATSVLPENANTKAVRLTVSDPSIAYIDENGVLIAKGDRCEATDTVPDPGSKTGHQWVNGKQFLKLQYLRKKCKTISVLYAVQKKAEKMETN